MAAFLPESFFDLARSDHGNRRVLSRVSSRRMRPMIASVEQVNMRMTGPKLAGRAKALDRVALLPL